MKVNAVPCPLCGMPPEPGHPDSDGFHYMMCVNREDGCPKESSWGQGRTAAVLAWNRDVMTLVVARGAAAVPG